MFLSLTTGEITGIIGAAATVLTVFIVPIAKSIKKRIIKMQQEKMDQEQAKIERQQQQATLTFVVEQLKEIKDNNNALDQKIDNFLTDYDEFTTQNLKYMTKIITLLENDYE